MHDLSATLLENLTVLRRTILRLDPYQAPIILLL